MNATHMHWLVLASCTHAWMVNEFIAAKASAMDYFRGVVSSTAAFYAAGPWVVYCQYTASILSDASSTDCVISNSPIGVVDVDDRVDTASQRTNCWHHITYR